jgi:(p)ppGpp synthase/HD superfamily hydrolase
MVFSRHQIHRERIRAFLLGKSFYLAVEALGFAESYHTGIRKDGVTPEFHHQISIAHFARTLAKLRHEEAVLCAALLHDVVEDYDVPIETIRTRFGNQVGDAVMLLTKKYRGAKKDTAQYYIDISNCPIASIVKGCDRIHNFQTMPNVFSGEKQTKYMFECESHILPMLNAARNRFPDQELAYENIKYALKSQIDLIRLIVEARDETAIELPTN